MAHAPEPLKMTARHSTTYLSQKEETFHQETFRQETFRQFKQYSTFIAKKGDRIGDTEASKMSTTNSE